MTNVNRFVNRIRSNSIERRKKEKVDGEQHGYQVLQNEWQGHFGVDGSNQHYYKCGRVLVTVIKILAGFLGIHFGERLWCPILPVHNIQSKAQLRIYMIFFT